MSKRKAKFKIGDTVRIDKPLHVVRVGYPKCVEDFAEEADVLLLSLEEWLREKKLPTTPACVNLFSTPIARLLLRRAGFGGNERALHTEEQAWWRGKTGTVKAVTYKRSGTYCAATFSGSGPDWEPEFEPAYLENVKSHRLLQVAGEDGLFDCIVVEDAHVTLIAGAGEGG